MEWINRTVKTAFSKLRSMVCSCFLVKCRKEFGKKVKKSKN